jgi:hypothetical protein
MRINVKKYQKLFKKIHATRLSYVRQYVWKDYDEGVWYLPKKEIYDQKTLAEQQQK